MNFTEAIISSILKEVMNCISNFTFEKLFKVLELKVKNIKISKDEFVSNYQQKSIIKILDSLK